MAAKPSIKSSRKSKSKKAVKNEKKKATKAIAKDLRKEVVDWMKANPGRDVLKAAIDEFGISYDHLTEWLKKEGIQVKESIETLIQSKKNKATQKGEDKLKELAKAIEEKKAELEKWTHRLKAAAKKK